MAKYKTENYAGQNKNIEEVTAKMKELEAQEQVLEVKVDENGQEKFILTKPKFDV